MNSLIKSFWHIFVVENVRRSKESKYAPRNSVTKPDTLFKKPFSVKQIRGSVDCRL